MPRIHIPPIDVPAIDIATGRLVPDWYDVIKGMEKFGLLDLADVPTTTPTNGQQPTWDATNKKWTWT